jgi:hypothetical protein
VKRFALAVALVALAAFVVVPSASALAFADAPCTETHPASGVVLVCAEGTVGGAYSVQLAAKENSGNGPPYSFLLKSGALPTGLSLSSDGVISGRPTTAGAFNFGVELQDNPGGCAGCGCVNRTPPTCAFRDFSIAIKPGLFLSKDPRPVGTVGVPYSNTITAFLTTSPTDSQPAAGPLAWSVISGAPPPGVTLGGSDGVLSGTPTTVGSYTFTVQAVLDPDRTDTETYTIVIRDPLVITPLSLHWEGLHGSEVGVTLSTKLTATGGTGVFTWTLASGSLPTGVALGPDGTIAGKPKVSGKFAFTAQVSDDETRTATVNATLVVNAKLAFKTLTLKGAKVGKLYNAKLATVGGVNPVKWKILRGTLPRGLHFAKKLGMFTGTPKREGTYRLTVQVVDGYGITSQHTFVLVVKA